MAHIFGAPQGCITFPTAEVFAVVLVLVCSYKLVSEYQFVTRVTPGSEQLRVMPPAVQPAVVLRDKEVELGIIHRWGRGI